MTPTGRTWLSRQAPELVARLHDSAQEEFHCDLLIVGSGYGGAVAAARAAGHEGRQADGSFRPARGWVLERGSEYLPGMFPSRFAELAGHVRFDTQNGTPALGRPEGLFDARIGADVGVLLGNGLGGGSLINAGVMERPDDAVFAQHWPTSITRAELDDGYRKVHDMLQPRSVPAKRECSKLHVLDTLVAPGQAKRCEVTVHWHDERNAANVDMRACSLCGDCLTGCNQGAKGSLDTNYLAFARTRGVEMFCGGTVRSVARAGLGWNVQWQYTERKLHNDDTMFVVRARRVVLAAGTLGSTEILLRSQSSTLAFSGQIGRHFSANGDKITAGAKQPRRVGAVAEPETDPADPDERRVGPTITGLLRVPPAADGKQPGFALEEFAVPAGLRNVYGEIVALLAALGEDRIGAIDPYAVTDDDIDRIALYGSMGDDGARGAIELPPPPAGGGGTEGVKIKWLDLRTHPLFKQVGAWLQARQYPAITVPSPSAPLPGSFLLTLLPPVTVHPLGGCRMADAPDAGVVDSCGRVFDPDGGGVHDGLFVLDGSIVPRALGINPAFTIAALAERAMPLLLRDWRWQAAGGTTPLAPRPRGRRRELPARDIVWSIRERVQGPFAVNAAHRYWARLEIEFEEIPGFRRALALTSRTVTVRRADLALYPARPNDDEFTVDDPDTQQPVVRATLAGSVELFAPVPGAAPDDERTRLVYRLSVQSVQGDGPLAVGGRLDGVKVVGRQPAGRDTSPWRQLSEMEMRYDGGAVGRWALDLADLAQRRDPLLRAVRLSSMPDMLDDAGAVVFYVLRRMLKRLLGYSDQFMHLDASDVGLAERWPVSALPGAQVIPLCGGARLTHIPPASDAAQALPPVMLIHGLGSAGAGFLDDALPNGLATTLRATGRDVWLLDVRSSTGNEFARHPPALEEAKRWTVDGVARDDLPAAIDEIRSRTGQPQVDVFAHCMGAVMFCLAMLGSERLEGKVRAAVLSQVGPLVRFSPMNRLRGYVASYLQQFLRIDTLDTAPNFVSHIENGQVKWRPRDDEDIAAALLQWLVDLLLFTFPYADDDDEAGRQQSKALAESDFRRVRHRGDAIFGQLFELANVSDAVLLRLQAFLGWVMVPMLAQAIHFARRNMLTDASGRNTVLHHANFARRFSFPVLIVHGRRNRVFDWRGSLASWRLLTQLRRDDDAAAPEALAAGGDLYGKGTRTQLAVLERYGHLDCLIGTQAHADVFPLATAFLNDAHRLPNRGAAEVNPQIEAPWIGPMLGWLQLETGEGGKLWWRARVLIHATPRRAGTRHVVVMPMQERAGALVPLTDHARVWPWRPAHDRAQHTLLSLRVDAGTLHERFHRFAVLTVHDDLRLEPEIDPRRFAWSDGGDPIGGPIEQALERWCADPRHAGALTAAVFTLAPKLQGAMDRAKPSAPPARLSFALASCQYPPGLFDHRPAQAAYERLHDDAASPDGPQWLVLCGDQVYLDETAGAFDPIAAARTLSDVHDAPIDRSYELNWQLPPMRQTVARLPVVAMFDDHEIQNDWKGLNGQTEPPRDDVARALAAFERYQGLPNPARPLVADTAAGRSFVSYPGGVPLIVLDTRSRRSLRDAAHIEQARIVPAAVMQALCARLADPAAAALVKFVVSPSPILPPERFDAAHPAERLRSDTWSGFPASTVELLAFIRDHDIRRVVFLSGDAHLSSVSSLQFEGGTNRVVSIVSSGLYTPWPFVNQRPDELVLGGAIDLGWPGRPFVGSMTLHAMSAHAGHAAVTVEREDDGSAWLDVSLRAAHGPTTDCRIELR